MGKFELKNKIADIAKDVCDEFNVRPPLIVVELEDGPDFRAIWLPDDDWALGVNIKLATHIGKKFKDRYGEQVPKDYLRYCVYHEVAHVALGHRNAMVGWLREIKPGFSKYDQAEELISFGGLFMNIIGDAEVYEFLEKHGHIPPEGFYKIHPFEILLVYAHKMLQKIGAHLDDEDVGMILEAADDVNKSVLQSNTVTDIIVSCSLEDRTILFQTFWAIINVARRFVKKEEEAKI